MGDNDGVVVDVSDAGAGDRGSQRERGFGGVVVLAAQQVTAESASSRRPRHFHLSWASVHLLGLGECGQYGRDDSGSDRVGVADGAQSVECGEEALVEGGTDQKTGR